MDDKFTVTCYICGDTFSPDPTRVKLWADSGKPFDPTDWTCPPCTKAQNTYLDSLDDETDQLYRAIATGQTLEDLDDDPYTWPCNNAEPNPLQDDRDYLVHSDHPVHNNILYWTDEPDGSIYVQLTPDEEADAEPLPPMGLLFDDDRDFDTQDDQQPMYTCDYCQTALTYLEGDYLSCLNCSAQYTLVYDPETHTYEARPIDGYDIWLTNYLQQHRIVADLEKRLEDERAILDNLTFARPEPPSTPVHPVHNNTDDREYHVFELASTPGPHGHCCGLMHVDDPIVHPDNFVEKFNTLAAQAPQTTRELLEKAVL